MDATQVRVDRIQVVEDLGNAVRVAYLVNQYPKVSHSFIRREIHALEAAGVGVDRYAIRGWSDPLVDERDLQERRLTRYVLQAGVLRLMWASVLSAARHPVRFAKALVEACHLMRGSERPALVHLIYLAEAALLAQWVLESGVRHLHAHFGTNSATVALLAHKLGLPGYSLTIHGPEEFDKPLSIGLTRKLSAARFVVAISSYGRSQLFRWLPYEQWRKVQVVRCGLQRSFLSDTPALAEWVRDPRTIVCVGRLCEQKGQLLLVDAVGLLNRRGVEVRLVLAGDGEMRSVIEDRVQHEGLGEKVRISGWIDEAQVKHEIRSAHALALPSFAEGLPVVIMEAMALRRPVISTYVAGIPELVKPGVSGWLVSPGDVEALATAIEACLDATQSQLDGMTHEGFKAVEKHHVIEDQVALLAEHFRQAELQGHTACC